MAVKFVPTSTIKATLGIQPNGKVHAFFTNNCYKHMDKYVPMDNGDLRNDVTITTNSITYEVPYAMYQYRGMREDGTHKVNPDNYTTPGTGTYWDKQMWTAEGVQVIKETQEYARRLNR